MHLLSGIFFSAQSLSEYFAEDTLRNMNHNVPARLRRERTYEPAKSETSQSEECGFCTGFNPQGILVYSKF